MISNHDDRPEHTATSPTDPRPQIVQGYLACLSATRRLDYGGTILAIVPSVVTRNKAF